MAAEQFRLPPSFVPRQGVGIMVIFVRPGPVGLWDHEDSDFSHSEPSASPGIHPGVHGLTGINPDSISDPFWSDHFGPDQEHLELAALVYGEAWAHAVVYEEMAAIANTAVRYMKARGFATVDALRTKDPNYSYAMAEQYGHGYQRYQKLMASRFGAIKRDEGMSTALRAAENALGYWGYDYSHGAIFWGGWDLITDLARGRGSYYNSGVFIPKQYNIFDIKDHKHINEKGKLKFDYKYEVTAAYGRTMFMRLNEEWKKANNHKTEY